METYLFCAFRLSVCGNGLVAMTIGSSLWYRINALSVNARVARVGGYKRKCKKDVKFTFIMYTVSDYMPYILKMCSHKA